MKKILILCPYPENVAPSQRLKFEQYYPAFRDAGYELTISPFISPSFWKVVYKKGYFLKKTWYTLTGYGRRVKDILRLHKYDIVYVHLWVTPFGFPFFEWLTRRRARKIIYDIDDLVYLKDLKSKATPFISYLKGTAKPLFLMREADHVITCTPYLDNFVRQYNKCSTDISSTVDTHKYHARKDYSFQEEKLVLGWSGSYSTSKYLYLLTDVFRKLNTRINFKLIVLGDKNFRIKDIDVEAYDWTEDKELSVLSRFDIGLYPLPNEEWVFGKSGLKAIQYMALGIPTIATEIGTNYRVINNTITGFLVKTEEEWLQKIEFLAQSEELRARIGKSARQSVELSFSIDTNKNKYLEILREI